ncbi:glycoside hydrolase family protein [Flammeovirga aprica]|uniref:Iota-carrageenase A2 n=1 Tax=Flammeovirga aprica JL-4 TaxID=694437 RepID=A0A7X9RWR3_9BACT|nr:glycosyl hydrolase family 28-related protein [Flammeovirga aprica]NME70131.1 Iota-carrageenase A2 [Flammeovirga aprica JL-4]
MKKLIVTLGALLVSASFTFAQKESDFYQDKIGQVSKTVDLVKDYKVNNKDDRDDSAQLQKAIDDMTALKKGGRINITAGKYYFGSIEVKSNVHIVISKDAVIYPTLPEKNKNYGVFDFGTKGNYVENVSVRGDKGQYKVDVSKVVNKNVRVFSMTNAHNFLIADMNCIDDNTKFSSITMGYSKVNGKYVMSDNGVVKNCRIEKAHYGYGLVQSQALKNVFFKDLWGDGGVTLRLETGLKKMNNAQTGGNHDIYAKNIYCQNGNAGVMISPHAIRNGHVEVDGVETVNTGFALRIDKGYTNKEQKKLKLQPGYYANTSIVKNVKATYGENAQVKPKHFKYITCDAKPLIHSNAHPDGESYPAPAVAAILYRADGNADNANGYYNVKISNVEAIGFPHQKKAIINESDEVGSCEQ